MAHHLPFDYRSEDELYQAGLNLGLEIPFRSDISPLLRSTTVGGRLVSNRLAVQPMEGADAFTNGSPSELTLRRYRRYAEGGSGLIWFEATAVTPPGRSNPRQMMLTGDNLESFRTLVDNTRAAARARFGQSHEIFCVLQLTHSGRYSKPKGNPRPLVAAYNPYLDKLADEVHILSDEELGHLQNSFLDSARLAYHAGFDAVDIKSCHGYLLNELLGAYSREHSRYGKSFESRTRFLTEVFYKIQNEVPDLLLSTRLSVYDGIPFPYGFGFAKDSPLDIDLTETTTLIRRLQLLGCVFLNISMGNPYVKPHLGRPFDRSIGGSELPDEHPLEGVMRLLKVTGALQRSFPEMPTIGTGYSWLRQFFPQVGAAVLARQEATFIGLGRSALAYPSAPRDLMDKGSLDSNKVCLTCSKCSELLRGGITTGCVVRDSEIYAGEYQKLTGSGS